MAISVTLPCHSLHRSKQQIAPYTVNIVCQPVYTDLSDYLYYPTHSLPPSPPPSLSLDSGIPGRVIALCTCPILSNCIKLHSLGGDLFFTPLSVLKPLASSKSCRDRHWSVTSLDCVLCGPCASLVARGEVRGHTAKWTTRAYIPSTAFHTPLWSLCPLSWK